MPGGIGSWLPSLAWATLPQGWQLPSLPAFTTRHWQQRLLRYLIRRTLGGVLRLPDDDIENSTFLDADLASGSLRLRDVELDEGAINGLLRQQLSSSGVSGTLKSGRIASIEVLVGGTTASPQCGTGDALALSATERLFSAPVSINITGLTLDFRIDALPVSPGGKQPASPGYGHAAHEATAGVMDLGASIHYIASDFVEGTSSPASPSESYTADASQSISLPGGFEDRSGSPDNAAQGQALETQVGIVAKIVETLLARLQLSISDVTVKLSLAGQCDFELAIQRLSSVANTTQKGNLNTATRTLVLSGFDVCYLSSTAEEDHQAEDKGRKAYASTSDDSASIGSSDDLAMSVAVQDLRQSLIQETDIRKSKSNDLEQSFTSDDSGGHSIYEDFDASVNLVEEVGRPLEDSAEKQQLRAHRKYRIFGLFPDVISKDSRPSDVTVHIITTAFAPVPLGAASSPSSGRASPVTRIEMQAPFVAAFVNFKMVDSCLSFFRSVQAPSLSTARDDASDSSRATPPSLVLHSKIQGFKLFTNLGLETLSLSKLVKMDTSGCRSPLVYLFFDKLELAHRTESSDGKLTIQDFGLAIRPQGRAAYHPIVLPDPGLLWLYDVEATAVKARTPQEGDWGRATYSSLQEWRTHLPNNAASMSASTRLPMLKDAVASRWTSANIEVNMQPIQIWLDTELILESLQAMEAALARRALRYTPISQTGAAGPGTEGRQLSSRHLSLTVPCARINFRCPSLPKEGQSAGQLRGGLVSIDVHDLVAKQASANRTRPPRRDASQLVMSNVFVHASTRDLRYRSCLLKIASGSRKHAVVVTLEQSLEKKPEQSQMHVSVTQVTAWLDKRAASAVQYLADDAGQTLARINSLVSSILSAFRSPQIGQSVPSAPIRSDATSLAPNEPDSLSIELLEGKASLDLSGRHASASRSCDITLRQALVRVGTGTKRNELAFILKLAGIDVVDSITDAERSSTRPLFQCYQPPQAGCLHLRLTSSTDQNLAKSSRLKCRLHGLEVVLSPDLTILEDVAQCLKTPPGAFSDVEPTQSTGITVELQECRVRAFPRSLPSAVVLHVQSLRFRTLLSLKASLQQYHLDMAGLQLWVIDVRSQDTRTMRSLKNAGYAQLLTQQGLSMRAAVAQPSKITTILLQKVDGTCIATCPDTLLTLSAFLSDCALPAKGSPTDEGAAASDLSASIMLSRPSHAFPWTIKEQSTAGQYEVVSDVDGDSIAVHSSTMKVLVDHEWLNQARRPSSKRTASPAFTLRARLTTFKLSLYEGYDFERTQCHIKRTVKATRRKLEKIRQLLAEGQVPDQTMQEAADTLLQSVFLPPRSSIPQDKEDEDASNTGQDVFRRIVAFDDELDQEDDHLKESLATWETLVNEAAANKRLVASPSSASRPAMSSRRLTRPKSSAIDICVIDPEIKFTAYSVDSGLVSKISIQVANFNILDNMETSTWHKFLTELRPRDGGITRPTGSNMVNLKLQMYRAGPSSGPEADLFLRVAPLRLHVDQDALDFLKAFFAFKIDAPQALQQPHPPCSWTPPTSSEAKDNAGFIQRVEICAIKIKLDYKPKRVDYNALRQGRAIEMMNFFHFEASEMVLRHLVLEGVQDWAKVGDMLQDIWTPDVKANQLADFLSGINPIRSVVNVGHGVADLLLLPVAQYKKDGRVGRGLQRGGAKFAKSTAMEAINIGARLATGTQVILEHAESILGGRIGDLHSRENVPISHGRSPSTPATERHGTSDWLLTATDDDVDEAERSSRRSEAVSRFAQQPDDVGAGLQTAYRSLSGNVRSAAETILAVPMEVYERSNEGPVRTVVRAVPIAVLRPMIGASEAVSKTLLGLRNTLDPGIKGENQDKYKRRSHTS